jgi:DNA invertase Pin-like site-specific DNA recombinase
MTVYGDARASTDGQTLDAQIAALKAVGAEEVYSEKQSGEKTDRAALARALASLESRDVLLVTRLDRLARRHQGPKRPGGYRRARAGSDRWRMLGPIRPWLM